MYKYKYIKYKYIKYKYIIYKYKYIKYKYIKAVPLPAWTGPETSRWLRLPDIKTIGT
jgi:hypothetical protein